VTKKNTPQITDIGPRCTKCGRGNRSIPLPAKKFQQYQKDIGPFLGAARDLNIKSPVNIEAHYFLDANRKSDLTNYHAALHDALVFYHVIDDDNRRIIVSTDGSRVYVDKENPRTEVIITPAADKPYQVGLTVEQMSDF
jgi:Holliday junction resolvase RusA-like endonuclease